MEAGCVRTRRGGEAAWRKPTALRLFAALRTAYAVASQTWCLSVEHLTATRGIGPDSTISTVISLIRILLRLYDDFPISIRTCLSKFFQDIFGDLPDPKE